MTDQEEVSFPFVVYHVSSFHGPPIIYDEYPDAFEDLPDLVDEDGNIVM